MYEIWVLVDLVQYYLCDMDEVDSCSLTIDHIDMNGVWNVYFGMKEDVWPMLYDL